MGFYLLSVLLILFFFWDGKMVMHEAAILGGTYLIYLVCVGKWSTWLNYTIPVLEDDDEQGGKVCTWSRKNMYLSFIVGIALI